MSEEFNFEFDYDPAPDDDDDEFEDLDDEYDEEYYDDYDEDDEYEEYGEEIPLPAAPKPKTEAQLKKEKIAAEIIRAAKNRLLINMRFMDLSLNKFALKPDYNITKSAMCDGAVFVYNPNFILKCYLSEDNLPIHNFLHTVLHCVFKHFFVNTLVDRELWDIACDIAVECAINDLELPFLKVNKTDNEIKFFNGFKENLSIVSAEKIYNYLLEKKPSDEMRKTIGKLFKGDDHELWYLTEAQKAALGLGNGTSRNSDNGEQGGASGFSEQQILANEWGDIAQRMQTELETFGKNKGNGAGLFTQNLKEVNRERYNYTEFLKKFAVRGEVMKLNPDEFDYNYYTYGLQLYDDMPLIEPLEYKDVKRIRDFAIVIDTSGSVSGDLVQTFVQKTYNILKSTDSFFSKINLHIIQCDAAIQEDIKITTQAEFDDYLKNMQLHGFGGTDFRPAFSYVNSLVDTGEFENLKGLIYFTDGCGDFPSKKPPYDAAFVFIEDGYNNYNVPSWAIKLVLRKEEI